LSVVPAEGTASVIQAIESASQSAGLLGLLGLFGLLLSGFSLFDALEMAFSRVYRAPPHSFVRQKLIAAGMVLLFAVLVLAMLAATTVAQLVGRLAQSWIMVEPAVVPAVAAAGGATSLLAAFALCFAIFYVVPNVRLAASQVLPGTLFASVALVLLTQAFPLYALYIGNLNQYGAIFGLFFLLMTWAYLVAQALMVGVELNALFRPVVSEKEKEPGLTGERRQISRPY
jgi:YihY family inner membrane protein